MVYYHVTAVNNLPGILDSGLKPASSGSGLSSARPGFKAPKGVYLFGSLNMAESWAMEVSPIWVILKVEVPNRSILHQDPDFPEDWNVKFVKEVIPSANIAFEKCFS